MKKMYMNIATGSVDTFDNWYYKNIDGETVNAVELGEVIEVQWNSKEQQWEEVK